MGAGWRRGWSVTAGIWFDFCSRLKGCSAPFSCPPTPGCALARVHQRAMSKSMDPAHTYAHARARLPSLTGVMPRADNQRSGGGARVGARHLADHGRAGHGGTAATQGQDHQVSGSAGGVQRWLLRAECLPPIGEGNLAEAYLIAAHMQTPICMPAACMHTSALPSSLCARDEGARVWGRGVVECHGLEGLSACCV